MAKLTSCYRWSNWKAKDDTINFLWDVMGESGCFKTKWKPSQYLMSVISYQIEQWNCLTTIFILKMSKTKQPQENYLWPAPFTGRLVWTNTWLLACRLFFFLSFYRVHILFIFYFVSFALKNTKKKHCRCKRHWRPPLLSHLMWTNAFPKLSPFATKNYCTCYTGYLTAFKP